MAALSGSIGRRSRARVVLSLTPLIDVVFILLVFFMLVSQFASWRSIDIIPQVSSGHTASSDRKTVVITVSSADRIVVEGEVHADPATAAAAALALKQQDMSFLIRPDGDVAIQPVVDLVEAVTRIGITDLRVEAGAAE